MLSKCAFCVTIFDFKLNDKLNDTVSDAKNLKRQYLLDLIAVFDSDQPNELRTQLLSNLEIVFSLVQVNLFRTPKVQVTAQQNGSAEEHLDSKKDEDEDLIMLEE